MNLTRIPRKDDVVKYRDVPCQVTKVQERPAFVTVWLDVVGEPVDGLHTGFKLDSFSPRDILSMLHQP